MAKPWIILAATLTAATAPSWAQDRIDGARLVEEIGKCRGIASASERLQCFDRTAAPLVSAKESGRLLILDRERTVERKRARFGLTMDAPFGTAPNPDDDPTEVREISSTIAAVGPGGYARYNLALANGSVWQTLDPVRFIPEKGAAITIRAAALGSFKAAITGLQTIKVKRVR